MATVSAVPNGTALTPPSSSHGTETVWNEKTSNMYRDDDYSNGGQNGSATHFTNITNMAHERDVHSMSKTQSHEGELLAPPYIKENRTRNLKDTHSPADSLLDLYASSKTDGASDSVKRTATEANGNDSSDDSSKWIHRDKLAKIENEELQAAGIVLPGAPRSRSKSNSRSRRDRSQDKVNGRSRSRKNSEIVPTPDPRTPELSQVPSWDLRLPEEIAEEMDGGYFTPHSLGSKGSKIPIAKTSPLPIPVQHLERDMPIPRSKRESSPNEEETIIYPKTRNRSGSLGNPIASGGIPMANGAPTAASTVKRAATDSSPKKPGVRKSSAKSVTTPGRPRTRGGPSKDSTSSGTATRPSTRSGDLSPGNKQMEGEPPWMVSAYKPDPRLPPDQQLLPTVARRLQQEKWEREGKFGSVYDKEFRPLNTDDAFLKPPEVGNKITGGGEEQQQVEEHRPDSEWPLKPDLVPQRSPRSPSLRHGKAGSYSTMPKVKDPPQSPLPSPMPNQLTQVASVVRVPDVPEPAKEESKKSGGCGCCIVM